MVCILQLGAIGQEFAEKHKVTPIEITLGGTKTGAFLQTLGPALEPSRLEAFEAKLGTKLPEDYRQFMLMYNGGHVQGYNRNYKGHGDENKQIQPYFCNLDEVEERWTEYDDDGAPKNSINIAHGNFELDVMIGIKGWVKKQGLFFIPSDDEMLEDTVEDIMLGLDKKKVFKEHAQPIAPTFTQFLQTTVPRITPENIVVRTITAEPHVKKAYDKLFAEMTTYVDEFGRVHINEEHILNALCALTLYIYGPNDLAAILRSISVYTFLCSLYLSAKDVEGLVTKKYVETEQKKFKLTEAGRKYVEEHFHFGAAPAAKKPRKK